MCFITVHKKFFVSDDQRHRSALSRETLWRIIHCSSFSTRSGLARYLFSFLLFFNIFYFLSSFRSHIAFLTTSSWSGDIRCFQIDANGTANMKAHVQMAAPVLSHCWTSVCEKVGCWVKGGQCSHCV